MAMAATAQKSEQAYVTFLREIVQLKKVSKHIMFLFWEKLSNSQKKWASICFFLSNSQKWASICFFFVQFSGSFEKSFRCHFPGSRHICWSTKRNWMALCWIWRRLNIHQWVSDLICKIVFLLDSSDLSPNRICKIMFQLDFQLKEEVGDTGTYVMNGEWALLGKKTQVVLVPKPTNGPRDNLLNISFRLF